MQISRLGSVFAILLGLPHIAWAGEECRALTGGPPRFRQRVEMCLIRPVRLFDHDRYILKFDGNPIFDRIDDESTEFDIQANGRRFTGGCASVIKKGDLEVDGVKMPIEVARICSVKVDAVPVGKTRFVFD